MTNELCECGHTKEMHDLSQNGFCMFHDKTEKMMDEETAKLNKIHNIVYHGEWYENK